MKSSTKDNIKMCFLICIPLLLLLIAGSFLWGKPKTSVMFTSDVKIVSNETIDIKKTSQYFGYDYAAKVQDEKGEYLRVLFYRSEQDKFLESRLDISKKEFDSLEMDKTYWFKIKLYNKDNSDSGIIKTVYNYDPKQ